MIPEAKTGIGCSVVHKFDFPGIVGIVVEMSYRYTMGGWWYKVNWAEGFEFWTPEDKLRLADPEDKNQG